MRGAVRKSWLCVTIAGLLGHRGAHEEARSLKSTILRALGPLLIIGLLVGASSPAFGAPIDDKRSQAAQVKAQIDALDEQLEIAAEEYNVARSAYEAVTKEVEANQARATELTARQDVLESNLSTRVVGMYRQGPLGALEVLLGASSFEEFAATWDLLQDMNDNDAVRVADLKKTRADLQVVQEQLAVQQAEARAHADTMDARKKGIEAQLGERQNLLSGIEAEIAEIRRQEEEEAARRAAAAAAAAKAKARPSTDYGNPTNAPRSEVVKIALSKLGAPYRWAASGPDAFDCSGFTMWCYAQIGVSLPHSSAAQISEGQRVSRENLEPGDLVFFGRSGIHHVGIYIGGGNFVHAPNTGDVVKVTSLDSRSDYVGACRP
ncbi:MAG: C40 family peptidase [Coriobacteriia bacterium]|nr:C40 family peptidase [Coriobacteriia bacterium]